MWARVQYITVLIAFQAAISLAIAMALKILKKAKTLSRPPRREKRKPVVNAKRTRRWKTKPIAKDSTDCRENP